jgi:hypothetical protein
MTFFQRLKRYMVGLGLGILLSIFFFQDRASLLTSWLPANRVKTAIIEMPWQQDSTLNCLLNCMETTEAAIKTAVDDGDVLFDESQVKVMPKRYVIATDEYNNLNLFIHDTVIVFSNYEGCVCD